MADINTEILTESGWKNPDKILPNELGLSLQGDYHVWSPMSIDIGHYNGDMFGIHCQSLDAQLTSSSDVLCRNRRKKNFSDLQVVSVNNLKHQIAIPAVSFSKTTCSLSDDQIRLAGWLMTDGSFSQRNGSPSWSIYQSKPSGAIAIEKVLSLINARYSVYERERDINSVCGRQLKNKPLKQKQFRINADSTRQILTWAPENIKDQLPKWFFDMSNDQFDVLLDALVAGDGSKYKNKECYILYGKYQLLSNIQYIALTHGWRAVISVARQKDFRLNLCRQKGVEFKPKNSTSYQPYSGFVWSAKTDTKNLMVRRNGTAYFLPTN